MFGKIIYISDNIAHINIPAGTPIGMNLINMNVVFEDTNKKILGEVVDVSKELIKVHFLGEINNGRFIGGVLRKPTMEANVRLYALNYDEVKTYMWTAVFVVCNLVLPQLFHLIPQGGIIFSPLSLVILVIVYLD